MFRPFVEGDVVRRTGSLGHEVGLVVSVSMRGEKRIIWVRWLSGRAIPNPEQIPESELEIARE
jgi:hypothetical protein